MPGLDTEGPVLFLGRLGSGWLDQEPDHPVAPGCVPSQCCRASSLDRTLVPTKEPTHNAVAFNIKGPSWRLREHRALTTMTTDLHHGRTEAIRTRGAEILDVAYTAHPKRFVAKPPTPPQLPQVAWINDPPKETLTTQ